MTVCIDTNSLIQLFGRRSRFRAIAVALMEGPIELALSTAILLEYEEVAADAEYVITEDRHFEAMRSAGYKPQPITPEEFILRLLTP